MFEIIFYKFYIDIYVEDDGSGDDDYNGQCYFVMNIENQWNVFDYGFEHEEYNQ